MFSSRRGGAGFLRTVPSSAISGRGSSLAADPLCEGEYFPPYTLLSEARLSAEEAAPLPPSSSSSSSSSSSGAASTRPPWPWYVMAATTAMPTAGLAAAGWPGGFLERASSFSRSFSFSRDFWLSVQAAWKMLA